MRRRWEFLFAAPIGLAIGSACVANLDGYALGRPDGGGADGASAPDGTTLPSANDAGSGDADAPSVDGGDAGCDGKAGPAMIRVGSYCIDTTEVTGAQYNAFLTTAPTVSQLPATCAFKTSFAPDSTLLSDDLPARYVDWCDAFAYCQWAGKRLCGAIGGGPASQTDFSAVTDEWYAACSQGGARVYPYGNTYGPTTCNGLDANGGAGHPAAVGSFAGCVRPEPGLVDMSGNVREWQDACDPNVDAGNELCVTRGGGADDGEASLDCAAHASDSRSYASSEHVGFRCCGD